MLVEYKTGNLLNSDADALVNAVSAFTVISGEVEKSK